MSVIKDHQGIDTSQKLLERKDIYCEKLKIKINQKGPIVNRTINVIKKQQIEFGARSWLEKNSVCWHVLLTTVLSMRIKYWLPHGSIKQHNIKATKTTWGYLSHREMFFPYNSFSLGFFKMSSARLGEDSCITNLSELPCNVDFNARWSGFKTRLYKDTWCKPLDH